jgi:hypothetical protein
VSCRGQLQCTAACPLKKRLSRRTSRDGRAATRHTQLTFDPRLVERNDFVNQLDAGAALLLRGVHDVRVSTLFFPEEVDVEHGSGLCFAWSRNRVEKIRGERSGQEATDGCARLREPRLIDESICWPKTRQLFDGATDGCVRLRVV